MARTNKHYVSPIDIKLAEFDKNHQKSASQLAEIAKYKRIRHLRDTKVLPSKPKIEDVWEDF